VILYYLVSLKAACYIVTGLASDVTTITGLKAARYGAVWTFLLSLAELATNYITSIQIPMDTRKCVGHREDG
jgi:hypothetical protein